MSTPLARRPRIDPDPKALAVKVSDTMLRIALSDIPAHHAALYWGCYSAEVDAA